MVQEGRRMKGGIIEFEVSYETQNLVLYFHRKNV